MHTRSVDHVNEASTYAYLTCVCIHRCALLAKKNYSATMCISLVFCILYGVIWHVQVHNSQRHLKGLEVLRAYYCPSGRPVQEYSIQQVDSASTIHVHASWCAYPDVLMCHVPEINPQIIDHRVTWMCAYITYILSLVHIQNMTCIY